MTMRVVAALGAGAAALAVSVACAGAAGAQTYPPAPNAITVDDPTPIPGQAVTVTLATCRPGTYALIGIDLSLVATPRVDSRGAAVARVTIPTSIRRGRHLVSGACLGADWRPLFLTTHITVEVPGGGATGGGGGGGGSATGPSARSGGAPALDGLAGPSVPADAALLYRTTAMAHGVTDGTGSDGAATGAAADAASGSAGTDSGPGTLGTIARVTLGMLAIGGVPVAMAIGRRPSAAVRSGFA